MSSQNHDASQPNQGNQPKNSTPPEQAAQPEHSPEPPSDDTALVWRQVKYYRTLRRPSMDGAYADFREIFNGWPKERFQKVHPEALRALRFALRSVGVYTGSQRKHTAEALAAIAQLPCDENGMWPIAPPWDFQEFLEAFFAPGSEAESFQQRARLLGIPVARWLDQQPQPPPPLVAPAPQRQATQGQIPAQHVAQPTISAPPQGPPVLGPVHGTQAQSGPATAQGPQQPPWPPIPQAPVPAPVRQAQDLAGSPWQSRQGQLQPGPQLQTNPPRLSFVATQPPQPNSQQAPRSGNNWRHRSEPYPSSSNPYSNSPFRPALQRAAAVSRSQTPLVSTPPVSGQTVIKDDRDDGDSNEMQD